MPSADLRSRLGPRFERIWAGRDWASNALLPLSWLFAVLVAARHWLHRHGWLGTHHLPVQVVVVGNLMVGGAGKTPATIAIIELLRRHGRAPGIVSRGYGRDDDSVREVGPASEVRSVGDEPIVLARRTGVPVFVGRDRVAAGHALLQAHPSVDIVVSDDGLQHLGLGRDLEVMVFDERGTGNARLLPAGALREPLPLATKPGRLILYNADAPTTPLPGFVGTRSLAGVVALDAWWQGAPPTIVALEALRGRRVVAAAGLARPGRFFAMLRQHGLDVTELALPDHHDFRTLPWPLTTGDVVITEKDAVKIDAARRLGTRIWVAALDFRPEPAFDTALLAQLPRPDPLPTHEPNGNPPP